MKRVLKVFPGLLILVLLFSAPVQATPLNLTSSPPDIFSSFTSVMYDAVTQQFTSPGFALEIDDDGVGAPETILGGTTNLSAIIDNSGNLISGQLEIDGTVSTLGYNSGVLLTGNLTDLGFISGGGDPIEFLFDITGGDAAGLYGPKGGVIMSFTGFQGSFNNGFSNNWDGVSDIFSVSGEPVPEPSTIALFLVGIAGLAINKTIKRNKVS